MGFRLRRVFNLGPLRATLSKTGVGLSAGLPGLRVGVGADGRRQVTLGFPGTGLSWTKSFGKPRVDPEAEGP